MSDNGQDIWQQSVNVDLEDLKQDCDIIRRDMLDIRQRLSVSEAFQVKHMTECHPAILAWQGRMWGKWLMVSGIVGGFCLVVGYVFGNWFPLWGK